jgi:hypothetical protein
MLSPLRLSRRTWTGSVIKHARVSCFADDKLRRVYEVHEAVRQPRANLD